MKLQEMYQALERLKNQGEIVNAYGGSEKDIDNPDGDILMDFIEYIYENYPTEKPLWMEAFFQVFNWQYSSMHEGIITYYDNSYSDSDTETILRVSDFLKENGYTIVAKKYILGSKKGLTDLQITCDYPADKKEIADELDTWINWNTETVWNFYLDILEKHKNNWPDINT